MSRTASSAPRCSSWPSRLVLVPLLTGLDPNVALFTAGAGHPDLPGGDRRKGPDLPGLLFRLHRAHYPRGPNMGNPRHHVRTGRRRSSLHHPEPLHPLFRFRIPPSGSATRGRGTGDHGHRPGAGTGGRPHGPGPHRGRIRLAGPPSKAP